MTKKVWFWFLAGWFFSLIFSPAHVTAMFGKKSG